MPDATFADMVQQEYYRLIGEAPPLLSADEARGDLSRVAVLTAEALINDDLRPGQKLRLLVRLAALTERAATDLGLVEPAAPVVPAELTGGDGA